MKKYEKITTVDHENKRKIRIYLILSESPEFILAKEVDKEGMDKDFFNKDGVLIETRHLIDVNAITKRVQLIMNKKYGELEAKPMISKKIKKDKTPINIYDWVLRNSLFKIVE